MIDVKFKKRHPDAKVPTYGTPGSACFDFYAVEEVVIMPGSTKLVSTGLSTQFSSDYKLEVLPRSGISLKTGIRVANAPGTVDSDYEGVIQVILTNTGSLPYTVEKHSRIAQGDFVKVYRANFIEVDELDSTERGEGGFGSSGI